MTLSITDAIRDGLEDFTRPAVPIAVVAFAVFNVLSSITVQTTLQGIFQTILGIVGVSLDRIYEEAASSGEVPESMGPADISILQEGLDGIFPLGIGALPGPVAVLAGIVGFLVIALLAELVYLVVVRRVAGDRFGKSTVSRLHFVLFHGVLAGLITMVLVFGAIPFAIVPAVIFAVLFSFVPQIVALEEVNAFRAIADSVGVVWENALRVFALAVIVFVVTRIAYFVVGVVPLGAWLSQIVYGLLAAVFSVLWLTIATEAYLQIRSAEHTSGA
ncbi:hypothetical protein [Halococcoides cellulosivorans]|uniref:YihY/virulence factor BrkB family protein n=1 Tax=Halococcoides cellulosivorans TaxID=1679096 RepID=A0A2R4X1B6_9EURY|nr:hypothetical protein [Halococcoides cellulosivorans]AWB27576.1 hypothetical protein HARCEL1_07560 [Halococcoides cellulosivorans]